MGKFSEGLFLILSLIVCTDLLSQEGVERQHRIRKSQFPSEAMKVVSQNNTDLKRLKFYREVDTAHKTYTAKFKKSRLFYEMDFDENGKFKSMAFLVKQVDIPEESFQSMANYLTRSFQKHRVRKMLQLYILQEGDSEIETIKNAFQNLMVPNMRYKFLIRGKQNGTAEDYEAIFDAEGNPKHMKKSLPANYDRVLY